MHRVSTRRVFQALGTTLVTAPLAAACFIGSSIRSPFGETEKTTSRSLPMLRLWYSVGLLVCGAVMLSFATPWWEPSQVDWLFGRNLLGFSGFSFLSARVLGAGLSWAPPLAYGATVLLAGNNLGEGWAWPVQPIGDVPSVLIASALFVSGLTVVCLTGARDTPGDNG